MQLHKFFFRLTMKAAQYMRGYGIFLRLHIVHVALSSSSFGLAVQPHGVQGLPVPVRVQHLLTPPYRTHHACVLFLRLAVQPHRGQGLTVHQEPLHRDSQA